MIETATGFMHTFIHELVHVCPRLIDRLPPPPAEPWQGHLRCLPKLAPPFGLLHDPSRRDPRQGLLRRTAMEVRADAA